MHCQASDIIVEYSNVKISQHAVLMGVLHGIVWRSPLLEGCFCSTPRLLSWVYWSISRNDRMRR